MAEKKSFLLYTGYFEQIEMLNIEQRGILLTAIMAFQTDAEMPEMDALTKMAFSFISADMRRDNEKYEEIVERRKESGRKGGLVTQAKRANAKSASFASNSDFKQNQANQANQAVNVDVDVNDDVNEDDDVVVNEDVSASDGRSDTHNTECDSDTQNNRPSNIEIARTVYEEGYAMDGTSIKRFVEYNDQHGWKMDWKEALRRWAEREKPPDRKPKQNRFQNFERNHDNDELAKKIIQMQIGGTT